MKFKPRENNSVAPIMRQDWSVFYDRSFMTKTVCILHTDVERCVGGFDTVGIIDKIAYCLRYIDLE